MNLIAIVRGHHLVAQEHIDNYGLKHKTTLWQAIRTTLHDIIHHKTIEINGAYVVYKVVRKYTLGIIISEVVSIYVPKSDRGNGKAGELLDLIPIKPTIMGIENDKKYKYRRVGTTYVVREDIQKRHIS